MKLINWDCLEEMDKLIAQGIKVDAIITDPPYKVISWWNKTPKRISWYWNSVLHKNDWKIFNHNSIHIKNWIGKCYNLLKEDSHCYIMTNTINLEEYLKEIRLAWFWLHNILLWKKNTKNANRWYMKEVEYIIFCRKWKAKSINNCWDWQVLKHTNPRNKTHPTEKPVTLLEQLIWNSTKEWDVVFDPFMWSGSCWVACMNTNREFIWIELDEDYFDIANIRILLDNE